MGNRQFSTIIRIVVLLVTTFDWAHLSAEELTLESARRPADNSPEEELAKKFSMSAAVRFLDQSSLEWTQSRKCFTCHTNYAYLLARPEIGSNNIAHKQVRESLEQLVEERWEKSGPRWDAEVVMSAAVLTLNDMATTGKLHSTTVKALDRMWTIQREDGGVDWLKCGWPPMESDDDYGAAMMAIAIGAAPPEYQSSPNAREGLKRLRDYFANNPLPTLHHRAMMLWADSYLGDLISANQKNAIIRELRDKQKPDGGWNLASLGDWKRSDGSEQDLTTSDGYATGFVIFVLRRAGVPANDAQLRSGVEWLKANQRISGRWYTRSLNKDNKHFISHAGSAFAVLALESCGVQN